MARTISLYYASIGVGRAFRALGEWLLASVASEKGSHALLTRAVMDHYPEAHSVMGFGSGRGALAACLQAAGIGPGDEVIVSAYTCLAVPTAVLAAGARPVYADIQADTLNVSTRSISAAMTPRVRAVVVQHTLGSVAPVADIKGQLAGDVLLIEDCALAVGTKIDGRTVGSTGAAALFSMELSKTISCGWGGVLVVNDRQLAESLQNEYDRLPGPSWLSSTRNLWQTAISALCHLPFVYGTIGKYVIAALFKIGLFRVSTPSAELEGRIQNDFVSRMGKAQSRLAALQWRDLERIAQRCDANARALRLVLCNLDAVMPGAPRAETRAVAPRVSFLAENPEAALAYFAERGIDLGRWFLPLCPRGSQAFAYSAEDYPNALEVSRKVVNVPCHSRMTAGDVSRVSRTLQNYAAAGGNLTHRTRTAGSVE